ncbi:MAG TPA: 2-oxoglutarate and iron-dependent oxygenase domain-containing protein [Jatrophihabitans sp.]|jgi:isopenicillin N synthase-like dioxygenase
MAAVPTIDLTAWFEGTDEGRAAVATQVDEALSSVGFLIVSHHGVPAGLRDAVRTAARTFFALPVEQKRQYGVTVMGRGWLPAGVEANGYSEGTETPPDLKETYTVGADARTAPLDGYWFQRNVYPAEVPQMQALFEEYMAAMKCLSDELLRICAAALRVTDEAVQDDFFTRHTAASTHTFNVNWYPPVTVAGEPEEGQFRIGPHTDFGTVTVLDREPGKGGLQIWTEDEGWQDAPYVPDTFTINTGDLLARWSGDRWKSNRHRVLPPQAEAPEEDLVSLVYFYEADRDTVVESLQPPLGKPNDYEPVVSSVFLRRLLDAITVG